MLLMPNWKKLLKTYSFIFHALSALVTFVNIILPYMSFLEPAMDIKTYGLVMFTLNVIGAVGRLMPQEKLHECRQS